MKLNKKSNSLQKISLNKTRKNNKNKNIEDVSSKIKEKNISLGKIKTKKGNEKMNNMNSIFNTIKSGDIKKFEKILKEDISLINKLNNNGLSLLHHSVIKNNKKIIELLLDNGADVNIRTSKMRRTPLHFAYIYQNNKSEEIINLLVKYGAKDDILDSNNKKPSQYKKNNNEKENKNGGENKLKKIKIRKERGKEGYKGNIYNLKDSKDNSFVIITMDNISYLTSDENTINQVSELTLTKNNSINNDNSNNNNPLEDSLEEKDINNKDNSLNDSLEMTVEKYKIPGEYVDNIFKNKYKYNNYLLNNIKDIDLKNSSENMDSFFTALITNKRNSFINSGKLQASMKTEDKNTIISNCNYTENSTFRIINNENDNEKKISNKISSHNSAVSTLSQTNKKHNKKSEIENIDYNEINNNCSYLLKWLIDIGLSDYYENFLNNRIFDINRLIDQMKSPNDKFGFEDIENLLGIHKPGHIFRLLVKLEIDGDIIDKSITNFMMSEQRINKQLIFSSEGKYECTNWCNVNKVNVNLCGIKNINVNFGGRIKNNLESFLSRNNLTHLYQNFYHNGFEQINYVILQMYSSYPINDDILENYFHIYNEEQRILTMEAIQKEVFKINNFINSEKYSKNENKDIIKYENVDFDEEENKDKNDKLCFIF